MAQLCLLHADHYRAVEDAIPGTRLYHQLEPFSHNPIGAKRCSEDAQYACIHNLFGSRNCLGSYKVVVFDQKWWLELVIEKNVAENDVTVRFLHPKVLPNFTTGWIMRIIVSFQVIIY